MIKLKHEYKIALTVIACLVLLVWGMNFLKGRNLFDTGTVFHGVYSNLDGLTEASPVYYHGYKIGSVREIEFLPGKQGRFVVTMSLTKEILLVRDTEAQIHSFDLMGTKAIRFLDGDSERFLQPGDTLQTSVEGGFQDQISSELSPLKSKTENLIVKMDTTLSGLSRVFSNQNNRSLEEGMNSFRQMMQNLERSSAMLNASLTEGGAINNSLASIDSVSRELNRQRNAIASTMENLAVFTEQLKGMNLDTLAARVDSSMVAVNGLLQQASDAEGGSLGLLLSDKGLYYNMMDASANLDRLLADVRHNPKRYLSFSAIDLGRKVYINVDDDRAEQQGIVYKVKIKESGKPLPLKNQMVMDQYRVFENSDGKNYTYTVGRTSKYGEITKIKNHVINLYPDAKVIAFKDGAPVKVKKALKLSEE